MVGDEELPRPWRLGEPVHRFLDAAVVVGLLAVVAANYLLAGTPWVWVPLGVAQIAPLYWRRRAPVPAYLAVVAGSAAQVLLVDTPLFSQVAFPLATYAVVRHASALWGRVALGVGLLASVVAALDWIGTSLPSRGLVTSAVICATFVVAAWALGTSRRTRERYVAALVDRGERIEREAAQQVALAAGAERARIAREMHDVVAHGLTTIVVQADGARYAAATRPEVAVETLERIASTGREALGDMRQLLGLLRSEDPDGATGRSPLPGLSDLPELVGDEVALRLEGEVATAPAAVQLTAYRVAQEALTNVRRHAGPDAEGEVEVLVGDGRVTVVVSDRGRGAAADDDGRGHGLRGMRERVDVHGGTLEAGPRPGGGFAVRAMIPW